LSEAAGAPVPGMGTGTGGPARPGSETPVLAGRFGSVGLLHDLIVPLALVGLVGALAVRMLAPLFPAMLWGAMLAIVCAHPYEALVSRLRGRRALADAAFALLMLLALVLPAVFFAWELVVNFPPVAERISDIAARPPGPPPDWLHRVPVIGPTLISAWGGAVTETDREIPGLLSHLSGVFGWIVGQAGSFAGFMFDFILGATISLFLLHHRFAVRAFLDRFFGRVGGSFARGVVIEAFEVMRTSFTGVIAAAFLQTVLATIALYAAGLPAIVLLAGATFLLAIVQIGPIVVMLAADVILVMEGRYLAAALVTAWFLGVVMSADNVIRPYFASRGTAMPAVIAFLGSIGGLMAWGLIGVFVGPVLMAVFYQLIVAWTRSDGRAGGLGHGAGDSPAQSTGADITPEGSA
jgi:predicted PurR-regulated permease PerM